MTGERTQPQAFYVSFAWVILGFVVISFVGKALFDAKDLPPITPLHHAHALTMGAWFVLTAAQATLAFTGRIGAHRALGRLSPLVVIGFIAFALPISKLNWDRMGEPLIITANAVNLMMFLALYGAAIALRRDTASHQRLMMFASLSILGPAAGRIPEIFDASPFLALPLLLIFQGAMIGCDLIVEKRLHPATLAGAASFVLAIALVVTLSDAPAWRAFLERALG